VAERVLCVESAALSITNIRPRRELVAVVSEVMAWWRSLPWPGVSTRSREASESAEVSAALR